MGVSGYFVNAFALIFLSLSIVFICFPTAPSPTVETFNWTPVIFVGVTALAILYYVTFGKHRYTSPRVPRTDDPTRLKIEMDSLQDASGRETLRANPPQWKWDVGA